MLEPCHPMFECLMMFTTIRWMMMLETKARSMFEGHVFFFARGTQALLRDGCGTADAAAHPQRQPRRVNDCGSVPLQHRARSRQQLPHPGHESLQQVRDVSEYAKCCQMLTRAPLCCPPLYQYAFVRDPTLTLSLSR